MSRPNQPVNVDETFYYDISIQDEDGVALDADSNPTVEYRIDGSDTLSASGITVAKVAATTGLYEVTFDLSSNASIIADSNLRVEETATISAVDYINRWSIRVRPEGATASNQSTMEVTIDAINDAVMTDGVVLAANSVSASALATDAVNEIADAVWDEAQSGHIASGSFGEIATEIASVKSTIDTNLDAVLTSRTLPSGTYFDPATDAVANVTLVDTTTTNTDMVSASVIADTIWEYLGSEGPGIFFDATAANTNTVFGTDGTASNPVSTFAAAKTLAATLGHQRIYILKAAYGTLIDVSIDAYAICGHNSYDCWLDLNSQDVSFTTFKSVTLYGTTSGVGSACIADDCILYYASNMKMIAVNCTIMGTIGVLSGSWLNDCNASFGNDVATFDLNGTSTTITNISGRVTVTNKSGGSSYISCTSGIVTIDATCTGGEIYIHGHCEIVDNSGVGCTVYDQRGTVELTSTAYSQIADDVWDEAQSGHVASGSFGEIATEIASVKNTIDTNLDAVLTSRTLPSGTYFDPATDAVANVTLADGPHGGTSGILTLERIIVESTTTNEPAMKLVGDGSGAGLYLQTTNSTYGAFTAIDLGSGPGFFGGSVSGPGMYAWGIEAGLKLNGGSAGPGISFVNCNPDIDTVMPTQSSEIFSYVFDDDTSPTLQPGVGNDGTLKFLDADWADATDMFMLYNPISDRANLSQILNTVTATDQFFITSGNNRAIFTVSTFTADTVNGVQLANFTGTMSVVSGSTPATDDPLTVVLNRVGSSDIQAILTDTGTTLPDYIATRTLPSGDYFNPTEDTVANVTLVGTTTTNTDMVTALTPSGIASAVWDAEQSSYATAGTFGEMATEIATIESDSAIGSGSESTEITIDDGTNPLEGVAVWITTDSAGANVIAGTLYTNTLGKTTFMLDVGTYYIWKQLSGYNFTNPQTLTVS